MTSFWLFNYRYDCKTYFFYAFICERPNDIEAMRVKLAVFTNTENSNCAKNSVVNDFKKCLWLFY